jgi:hypothetical protein
MIGSNCDNITIPFLLILTFIFFIIPQSQFFYLRTTLIVKLNYSGGKQRRNLKRNYLFLAFYNVKIIKNESPTRILPKQCLENNQNL